MPAVLQRECDGTGPGAFEELAVEGSRGKEGASGQNMKNAGKRPLHTRNVGVLLSLEKAKAKRLLKDAEKEKQEGTQGQWQRESPAKESGTSEE